MCLYFLPQCGSGHSIKAGETQASGRLGVWVESERSVGGWESGKGRENRLSAASFEFFVVLLKPEVSPLTGLGGMVN